MGIRVMKRIRKKLRLVERLEAFVAVHEGVLHYHRPSIDRAVLFRLALGLSYVLTILSNLRLTTSRHPDHMAGQEFFGSSELSERDAALAILGAEEDLCGRAEEDMAGSRLTLRRKRALEEGAQERVEWGHSGKSVVYHR